MHNLKTIFHVEQKVRYRNDDFDALQKMIPGIVTEVYKDHIIVNLTETDTDMWFEEGINLDQVITN